MIYVILASVAIMFVSLAGVFSVWKKAGHIIERNSSFLVSFAAGVFLIVSYNLTLEVLEHGESILESLIWVGVGIVGVLVFFKMLPHFHHHHDEHEEEHTHSPIDVRRILIGDGVHNIGDGILIAASFAVSPVVGLIATISVFVHELVQEVSEFFVLRQAGMSVRKALSINFAVSSTILIGALGGFIFLETFEAIEIPLLGIAAGSFFVVVIYDLIPHSVRNSRGQTHHLKHIVWFFAGVAMMFLLGTIFGHGHGHNEQDHDHAGELHLAENGDHEEEKESDHGHHDDHGHEHDHDH